MKPADRPISKKTSAQRKEIIMRTLLAVGWVVALLATRVAGEQQATPRTGDVLHVYTHNKVEGSTAYDEAMAAACLQGLINRDGPRVYLLPAKGSTSRHWDPSGSPARYWLDVLGREGR